MDQREVLEDRNLGNICMICGKAEQQGIHIVTEFICGECEAEIVKTDVMDAKYPHFIHQLKRLWYKKDA